MRTTLSFAFGILCASSAPLGENNPNDLMAQPVHDISQSGKVSANLPRIESSLISQTPFSLSRQNKQIKRMLEVEHHADENIRRFQENLEALRTTVEFEPVAI